MRSPTALLSLVLLLAPILRAQRVVPKPTRPHIEGGADSNDARTYYRYGIQQLSEKPSESVRGFYWALQLDPSSAETMYALRSATLLAMSHDDLFAYFDWTRKKRAPEFLALDSLLYRAYTLNPFVYRSMELPIVRAFIEAEVINEYPSVDRAELGAHVLDEMREMRKLGWMSYAEGRLPDALDAYARELHDRGRNKKAHEDDDAEIHADRARIFYQIGNMDSARAELSAAIAGMRAKDNKSTVVLYESKAMYEHSLGMIEERSNKVDAAREAYGRALQEELSYYAAHARLAQLQLLQGDTAAAISEMDLATQLQPNDPMLRYLYAIIFIKARRDADAAQQLTKAVSADPYFAAPHFLLARMADVEDDSVDAVSEYRQFIAQAARTDANLPAARDRMTKLTSSVAATGGTKP